MRERPIALPGWDSRVEILSLFYLPYHNKDES